MSMKEYSFLQKSLKAKYKSNNRGQRSKSQEPFKNKRNKKLPPFHALNIFMIAFLERSDTIQWITVIIELTLTEQFLLPVNDQLFFFFIHVCFLSKFQCAISPVGVAVLSCYCWKRKCRNGTFRCQLGKLYPKKKEDENQSD